MGNFTKKITESASKVFKWIFSDWRNIAISVLLVASIVLYFNYRSVNEKYSNAILSNNDTIEVYRNRIGELYSQNTAYITDINSLREYNEELYNEAKNLRENPIIVTKYKTVTEYRDIVTKDTVYLNPDGTVSVGMEYEDEWTSLCGTSTIDMESMASETRFDEISFRSDFTLDLIESKKGDLSFIVRSSNPYCQINTLNGVMLSPEDSKSIRERYDKPWCVSVGVGPSLTIVDNRIAVLPAVHLTLGRKILSF